MRAEKDLLQEMNDVFGWSTSTITRNPGMTAWITGFEEPTQKGGKTHWAHTANANAEKAETNSPLGKLKMPLDDAQVIIDMMSADEEFRDAIATAIHATIQAFPDCECLLRTRRDIDRETVQIIALGQLDVEPAARSLVALVNRDLFESDAIRRRIMFDVEFA